jgi:hypothetical protein
MRGRRVMTLARDTQVVVTQAARTRARAGGTWGHLGCRRGSPVGKRTSSETQRCAARTRIQVQAARMRFGLTSVRFGECVAREHVVQEREWLRRELCE